MDSLQDTVEKCQEVCRNNTDCKWFNYLASMKKCNLKYKKGYKQYKKGLKSGPPSCENIEPELDEERLNDLCIVRGKQQLGYNKYSYDNRSSFEMYDIWSGPPSCERKDGPFPRTYARDNCLDKNMRYVGFTKPVNDTVVIKSVEDCKSLCLATKECQSFSYLEDKCYLTETPVFLEFNEGAMMGRKTDCS